MCPNCLVFSPRSIAQSICACVRKELQAELLRSRNWELRDLLPAAAGPAVRGSTGRSGRSGRRGNPYRRSARGGNITQPPIRSGQTGYTSTRGSRGQSHSLSRITNSSYAAPHDPRRTETRLRNVRAQSYSRWRIMNWFHLLQYKRRL